MDNNKWCDPEGNEKEIKYPFLVWIENEISSSIDIHTGDEQSKCFSICAKGNDLQEIFAKLSKKVGVVDFIEFANEGIHPEDVYFDLIEPDLDLALNFDPLMNEFNNYIDSFLPPNGELDPTILKELKMNYIQDASISLLNSIYLSIVLRIFATAELLAIDNIGISGEIAHSNQFRKILFQNLPAETTLLFQN